MVPFLQSRLCSAIACAVLSVTAHDIVGARSAGMYGLLVNRYAEEAVSIRTAVLACITASGDAR